MYKGFVGVMNNGTLITSVLAILAVGGAIFLAAAGREVPDWLIGIVSLIIGAFFGQSNAPKQFRTDDAKRIEAALYETLPPHTKLDDLNKEFKARQRKE